MTKELSLLDILDDVNLPLKNRVNPEGYYAPGSKPGPPDSLIPTKPLEEGEQYRFHFDMSKCVGCQCCVVACNEQNSNPPDVHWRRVGEIEGGVYPNVKRLHLSMACNHCLDPSCLSGCPTDAYVKLSDGIVKHQAEECIGCGYCTWNCPYGVPQYDHTRNIVTKCDMCHSRLSHGQLPACVAACPQEAIRIEKVNVQDWREKHTEADAPYIPDSGMTLSTTRITMPKDIPKEMFTANRHRIEPEHAHTSLIFMTVLTQLSVGGFITLWTGNFLSRYIEFLKPLNDFLAFGAVGMLIVAVLALWAAIFHLGKPLYAYKALRMWRRSWLSREVLLFSLFSILGGVYSVLQLSFHSGKTLQPGAMDDFLGAWVVLLGIAGVYASAKIYQVPARPAWNTIRTPLRFFLTAFILGPLFSLLTYAVYLSEKRIAHPSFSHEGPVMVFLGIAAIAGLLQLGILLVRFLHLRKSQERELFGSTYLLIRRFRKQFLTRIVLLALACFLIPVLVLYLAKSGKLDSIALIRLSVISFVLSLAGEFLGRYLFFVTVVPKNIPGSFFTTNGERH